ncbi:MAG: hypothetical protein HY747_08080 [Elusimicrobia bacterium]|nr:hypothetical protein [Elusimicrobiota bacterium]
MFQGIVEQKGRIVKKAGRTVVVAPKKPWKAKRGESVAIDGVCLTVTKSIGPKLSFDLGTATLEITSLGKLSEGSRVTVHKGSIAIDGISLTINRVRRKPKSYIVSFCIIPETTKRTTLGIKGPGDWVNIETDYFARLITTKRT